MEIEVAFNFIYTIYYNGLMIFLNIFSTINMLHELNHQLLTFETNTHELDFTLTIIY